MTTDGDKLWWWYKTNGKIYDLNNLKTAEGHPVIGILSNHHGNGEDDVDWKKNFFSLPKNLAVLLVHLLCL